MSMSNTTKWVKEIHRNIRGGKSIALAAVGRLRSIALLKISPADCPLFGYIRGQFT
jgi:hypothetical protein